MVTDKKKEPGKALDWKNKIELFPCMIKRSRKICFATIPGGIIGKPGILSRVLVQKITDFTKQVLGALAAGSAPFGYAS